MCGSPKLIGIWLKQVVPVFVDIWNVLHTWLVLVVVNIIAAHPDIGCHKGLVPTIANTHLSIALQCWPTKEWHYHMKLHSLQYTIPYHRPCMSQISEDCSWQGFLPFTINNRLFNLHELIHSLYTAVRDRTQPHSVDSICTLQLHHCRKRNVNYCCIVQD